jgi:hypothetical protein
LKERRAPLDRDVNILCPSPTCDSAHAGVRIRTQSVITFRCAACRFMWSVEVSQLPEAVRKQLSPADSG